MWNIIHSTIFKYKNTHKEYCFIRHEDISANPVKEFGHLFEQVDLNYPPSVQDNIEKFSQSRNPVETDDLYSIKRNSAANIWSWKSRLSTEEIDRIRAGTEQVSSFFYDDGDW